MTLPRKRLICFDLSAGQNRFLDVLLRPIAFLNQSTSLLCLR